VIIARPLLASFAMRAMQERFQFGWLCRPAA
jgi:hypothetical protein